MDSGQLQAVDKYGSGVPFTGEIAEIAPPEQQLQQIIDALVPFIQGIIEAIVPLIEPCVDAINQTWNEMLESYPNKRIVHLAFYHKKARVRKKNLYKIIDFWDKAVKQCDHS